MENTLEDEAEETQEREGTKVFDTKHVFHDPRTMQHDGWPLDPPKPDGTLTGLVVNFGYVYDTLG